MNDICFTMIFLVTCVIIEIQSIFFIVDSKTKWRKIWNVPIYCKNFKKNILVQWYLFNYNVL